MDNCMIANNNVKVYPYRWIILFLFCLYVFINFMQFFQYNIINNIITSYYQISSTVANLAGIIFLLSYIVFFIPVNYILDKFNLRVVSIISAALTTIGILIKLLSVSPDRFYLVILGQLFCGIGQTFMLNLPPKVANIWFGPNEVSTACAIAVLGTQFGIAVGAVLPSIFVKSSRSREQTTDDLFLMLEVNAGISAAILFVVIFFFRARPNSPPSQSQLALINRTDELTVYEVIKKVLKNKDYIWVVTLFGICNGIWTSFGMLANQLYLNYFPDGEMDIGIICLITLIVGGCIGSVIFGLILDKTHKFKVTSVMVFSACALGLIFTVVSLEMKSKPWSYVTIIFFGFFMASTLVIGLEYITEVCHPFPEEIACSIFSAFYCAFATAFTFLAQFLFDVVSVRYTSFIPIVILSLLPIIMYFVSPNLNRRQANLQL